MLPERRDTVMNVLAQGHDSDKRLYGTVLGVFGAYCWPLSIAARAYSIKSTRNSATAGL
jgi:hypothetical protein